MGSAYQENGSGSVDSTASRPTSQLCCTHQPLRKLLMNIKIPCHTRNENLIKTWRKGLGKETNKSDIHIHTTITFLQAHRMQKHRTAQRKKYLFIERDMYFLRLSGKAATPSDFLYHSFNKTHNTRKHWKYIAMHAIKLIHSIKPITQNKTHQLMKHHNAPKPINGRRRSRRLLVQQQKVTRE
jgi:hypothetical protein